MNLGSLLTFGWASGYRTYVLAALGVLTAATHYAVGEQSAQDAFNAGWQTLVALGLGTLRAGVK